MATFENNNQIISVIVPVYNVAPYLERCIRSLLEQSYPQMEIILVNDGSTDASGEICDRWQKKNPKIMVIHQKNKGVSSARNTGLQMATGAYIGFVDPDDYVDKDMYMDLHGKLVAEKADIVACTFVHEFYNGATSFVQKGVNKIMTSREAIKYDLLHGMYITCNKLFSRKTCYNVIYDETAINGEDRLFDVMALLNADKVVYINKPYYHYYHRANSAGTKKYTVKDKSLIDVCKKIKHLLTEIDEAFVNLADAQIQQAYMQLLGMMEYKIEEYKPDSYIFLRNLRESIFLILNNKYNSMKFKIKTVLLCLSPLLFAILVKWKRRLYSK